MDLLTFDEALAEAGDDISILLGNGFSQAYDHHIFNYRNLLDNANFGVRHESIKDIFRKLETYDFEKVMQSLEFTEIVNSIYRAPQQLIDYIADDMENLKNALVNAIANSHPQRSSYVSTQQYRRSCEFISNFSNVFTLNYDLLLYWTINKLSDTGDYDDGFRRGGCWNSPEKQNIFFLHGALHLLEGNDGMTTKLRFNDRDDQSIIDAVADNLLTNTFPLFVSEPTSIKKLQKIRKSPYLNHCFEELKYISGSLFIHGHSMDENDRHIFSKINESNIDRVFISMFGNINSEPNRSLEANSMRFFRRDMNINFYDASSASIWN